MLLCKSPSSLKGGHLKNPNVGLRGRLVRELFVKLKNSTLTVIKNLFIENLMEEIEDFGALA